MNDPRKEEDDAALQARLARLSEALRAQEERRAAETAPKAQPIGGAFGKAFSAGLNVFSEFVAAVIVGAFLGWQADAWLGTKPWLLVLFLALGTAAGFWNLLRYAARSNARASGDDEPPPGG
ncbi:MAG TPA: AtpZ/AtpI family protein [Methylocystis sp.]|nr:AtpZ/AtpI family protein [Methylocystis sp.]